MKRILKTTAIAFIMILVSATVTNVTAQYYDNDAQYNNNGQQNYGNDRDVSYQQFYDELSPYGQWVDYPGQGYVWVPDAESDFRPYSTKGHWVWTEDYEWMWVSDYDWGWAPFHYGRWDNDPYYGWYWVPGYEWSPAWVAWRDGGDYYGWAPIRPGININLNFNIGSYSPPYDFWCFAPRRYISSPYINRYYVDPRRNVTIINQTNIIINNYRYGGNYGFRSGPRRMEVERYTGRINPVRFQRSYSPGRTSFRGNVVSVYRPNVRQDNNRNFAPRQVQQYERREGSFRSNRNATVNNGNSGRNNNINNRGNNLPDRRDIGRRDNTTNNRGNNLPDRRAIDRNNNNGQGRTTDGRTSRPTDRNSSGNDPRNDNRRFDRSTERNNNQTNLPDRQPDNRRVMNERPQRAPTQMEQRTTQPRQQPQQRVERNQPPQQMERRQPQRVERSQPSQQMERRTTQPRQQPPQQMERRQPQRVERSQPTQQPRQVDRTNNRPSPSTERSGNNGQSGKRRKF